MAVVEMAVILLTLPAAATVAYLRLHLTFDGKPDEVSLAKTLREHLPGHKEVIIRSTTA